MNNNIKFKLEKRHLVRLKNYLNSDNYNINQKITEHWSKREDGNKKAFNIEDDYVYFNSKTDTGLSFNYPNYIFKKHNYNKKRTFKSYIKKNLLNFLKLYLSDNFSAKKYFYDNWNSNETTEFPLVDVIAEFGNYDDYIIYNAAWFYNEIKYLLKINKKQIKNYNRCIEIGPGVGNLIRIMFAKNFISHATIIDLPTSIPFSFCNLINRFPEINYKLPNEIEKDIKFENEKIIFLTNEQLNYVPENFYSLGINTMSFGEMDKNTINNYFVFLRNVLNFNNLFYCVNRVEKDMKINNQKQTIKFFEYPWEVSDEDIFYRLTFLEKFRTFNPMYLRFTKLSK